MVCGYCCHDLSIHSLLILTGCELINEYSNANFQFILCWYMPPGVTRVRLAGYSFQFILCWYYTCTHLKAQPSTRRFQFILCWYRELNVILPKKIEDLSIHSLLILTPPTTSYVASPVNFQFILCWYPASAGVKTQTGLELSIHSLLILIEKALRLREDTVTFQFILCWYWGVALFLCVFLFPFLFLSRGY